MFIHVRFAERDRPDLPIVEDIFSAQDLLYTFFNIKANRESLYEEILSVREVWQSRLQNAFPRTVREARIAGIDFGPFKHNLTPSPQPKLTKEKRKN